VVPGGRAPCILKVSNYKGSGWPVGWPESFTHWIQLARGACILGGGGKKCGKAATWSWKANDNIKIDLKANVHWPEEDNDRVQWCSGGRDVECYCHIDKALNLQKWKSGIFKSAICQRQKYSVIEQDTSQLSRCMAQRDIMRNMDAICTLNYSFKLTPPPRQ